MHTKEKQLKKDANKDHTKEQQLKKRCNIGCK
jgi:hypothetical protein